MEIAVSKLEPEFQNLKAGLISAATALSRYADNLQDSKGQPITRVGS